MLVVAIVLALAIGAVLGMLGGGGAILTLPMLVYALHVEAKVAIATSLFVVGATSLAGMGIHARAGEVKWRVGGIFGAAAMAGAYAGGRAAYFVPSVLLLVLFGFVMIVTALAMLRGGAAEDAPPRPLAVPRTVALGAGVGALSGLVGAGGGFLIVPALTLFGGLKMREAVATSLFVIALQSFAGFAGHAGHVTLDWPLVLGITAAAVVGSLVGARASKHVSTQGLRRSFAWLVVVMGIFMLAKELPLALTVTLASATLALALHFTRKASPQAAHR